MEIIEKQQIFLQLQNPEAQLFLSKYMVYWNTNDMRMVENLDNKNKI